MSYRSHRTLLLLAILLIHGLSAAYSVNAAFGDLDPTFGNGGRVETTISGNGNEVSIQPDGKIIVHSYPSIYRFDPDGTLDLTFGTNGQLDLDPGGDFAILPDGRILGITSKYVPSQQQTYGVVYWYDADGQPLQTGIESLDFDSCYADTFGYMILSGLNGQIFVASTCSSGNYITRFNADGTPGGFGVTLGAESVHRM